MANLATLTTDDTLAPSPHLVVQARVAGRLVRVQIQEAEGGEPVLEGDDHHLLLRGQDPGVVDVQRVRPAVEAAAVYPHLRKQEPVLETP